MNKAQKYLLMTKHEPNDMREKQTEIQIDHLIFHLVFFSNYGF